MGTIPESDSIMYTRLSEGDIYAVYVNVFRTDYNRAVYGDPYDGGSVTVNIGDPAQQTAVTVYEGDSVWIQFGAFAPDPANPTTGSPGINRDIETSGSFTVTGIDNGEYHDFFGTPHVTYESHQFVDEVTNSRFSGSFFLDLDTGGPGALMLNDGPNVGFSVHNNGTGDGQPQTISVQAILANPDYDIFADALVNVGASGTFNYIDLPDITKADLPWNHAEMVFLQLTRPDTRDGTEAEDAFSGLGGDDVIRGLGANDRIFGGSGNDALEGNGGLDLLDGGTGNDTLDGGAGDDRLVGGLGDDLLRGGTGHDDLFGNGGKDRLVGAGGNDDLNGGADNDRLKGGGGGDRLKGGTGKDGLGGNGGNDFLYGQGGRDTMNGGAGEDKLFGGGGRDRMGGADGLDVLKGQGGNDLMFGGEGSDVLIGGRGSDNMQGDSGSDFFIFYDNDGSDTILDYDFYFEFDVIQIAGSATQFSDLIITDSGSGGTNISWKAGGLGSGTTITLDGYDPSEVQEFFFLFDQTVLF